MLEGRGPSARNHVGSEHGVITNTAAHPWVIAPHGPAVHLAGANDLITLTTDAYVLGSGDWTLSMLLRATSTAAMYLAGGEDATGTRIYKFASSTNFRLYADGGQFETIPIADWTTGDWHLLTMQRITPGPSQAAIQTFLNGTLQDYETTTFGNEWTWDRFGNYHGEETGFVGDMGPIWLHNRALSAPELRWMAKDPWCLFSRRPVAVFVPAAGTSINCTLGTIDLAANAATVKTDTSIACTLGTIDLAANNATVNARTAVDCTLGTIALAANAATVKTDTAIACALGTIEIASNAATIVVDIQPWYHATSLTTTTGSISSGTIVDTYHDDASELVLNEVTGAPGFAFDFTFGEDNAVPTTGLTVNFAAYYDGNPAHNVKLQQWNYDTTAWVNVTADAQDFPAAASEQTYAFGLIDDPDYLSAGRIQLRITHVSSGNPVHDFHVGQMQLAAAITIDCTLGTIDLSANDATVKVDTSLACTLGTIELASNAATIKTDTSIACTLATIDVAANDATVLAATAITCTSATVELASNIATVQTGTSIDCTIATIALTANAATVKTDTAINCTLATIVLQALDAVVSVAGDVEIACSLGTITLTANAASVSAGPLAAGRATVAVSSLRAGVAITSQYAGAAITSQQAGVAITAA